VLNSPIAAGSGSLWLEVKRAGNNWTQSWSKDGSQFTTATTFAQTITVARIGPFASNYFSPASATPAFTASVDYFRNASTTTTAPNLAITKSHTGNFVQGGTGTYSVSVSNAGTAPTSGTVTVTDTLPTGLTATALTGSGWSCSLTPTLSCSRGDALAAGATYPAMTLAVSVAANAPASVTNTANAAGGGTTGNKTVNDPTTITGGSTAPNLAITKSHTGNFAQGGTGTYTISVSNGGNAPTSGTVTVTDTLPTGLTATAFSGSGWSCSLTPTLSCSRGDALAAGATYPAMTLAVSVAANAPASVTNSATAAGGGTTGNKTVNDPTTITGATGGGPVSDEFNNTTLNTGLWTFLNPAGGSNSLNGTQLLLTAPAGATHDPTASGKDDAIRVMQTIPNADFDVIVKFDSIPTAAYTNEGIIVEQGPIDFLRFEVYGTGGQTYIFASTVTNSTDTLHLNSPIAAGGGSFWMRVKRVGNVWTQTWSTDGTNYQPGTSFTQAVTVARIGPFASNYFSPASTTPAFTASVDYFRFQ
jgi:uncharacterized repeat protein (TIGR01451 family)